MPQAKLCLIKPVHKEYNNTVTPNQHFNTHILLQQLPVVFTPRGHHWAGRPELNFILIILAI